MEPVSIDGKLMLMTAMTMVRISPRDPRMMPAMRWVNCQAFTLPIP